MKKLFYLLLIALFVPFLSCGQKPSQQHKNPPIVSQKIQNSFFGMTLGKTKIHQGEEILLKSGITYEVMDGFEEIALHVEEPMTFGDIQWESEEFVFIRNVLYQVSFSIDSASVNVSKTQRAEIYKNLLSSLKKKYPKYKIVQSEVTDTETDTEFKAYDKLCHVYLNYSNDNHGIYLSYSINPDKIDKIIPSDL